MRQLLLILFSCPLFAAYVGNPASPGIMNMGFFSGPSHFFKCTSGYLFDHISNKRYTLNSPYLEPNQGLHEFGIHSQMATLSAIFVERLELFGAAGGSKEHAKWDRPPKMADASLIFADFQSTYQFSWSAGCKVILLQWWQTYFSADFTYFNVPASHQSYFKFLNRLNLPLETEKQTFSIREWQVSAALSSRFVFLTPYGGVTYLSSKLDIHSGIDVPPLYYTNKDTIGYFFGLTLSLTGRFHLNIERRVRDEFAYGASAVAVF